MHKMIHWSQESRRPDSIWMEWMPNTFPFRNLAPDLDYWLSRSSLVFTFYFG